MSEPEVQIIETAPPPYKRKKRRKSPMRSKSAMVRRLAVRSRPMPNTPAAQVYREEVTRFAKLLAAGLAKHGVERYNGCGQRKDVYGVGAAKFFGITCNHISRIISGRTRPGMDLTVKIAETAGVPMERVLRLSLLRGEVEKDMDRVEEEYYAEHGRRMVRVKDRG